MRLKSVAVFVLSGVLLVVGCSNNDPDGASTTAATAGEPGSTVDPATSDVAGTDGTAPSRTITEVTTTTAVPTTTTAPPTTTLPLVEQVRTAMLGYYDFYWRCLRAPDQCDPLEVAVPASDNFNALSTGRDDLMEGGYYVGPEDVGYMVITAIEPKDDHTLVTTCWWSTAWLYFQPPIAGQAPTVQNNTPGSSVETYEFVQMPDLTWKVRRADTIESYEGENRCPPPA